ncbi:ABC transporter substrate-binding protein [Brachybacterium alimentarium]|uniref:ABC transporter substrate-binding protein n=1 Tax=Brachybacterium alimentarium TaxID=47845 RepID=UPI000BB71FFC|nr:sugar ABC transporter substrate-binding protein [Brachybacterium alimentarium]PCC30881.1 sugar-binding protein [Brachybacterium alimentarium]RCS69623.1 sugar ABC transporter substrate-binding protein [Brachybacterium alimentarium]RCS71511.1 sugar ABC transporter substrate-binding protein [Brachybacterium alimentarium]RCS77068.1 sugar ABC transporter substrate-binding protein [Brachybacterium alimentarium]RCS84770.1 sugar ABC transporter substrate-binding protein [Brachybacterium alimentariu
MRRRTLLTAAPLAAVGLTGLAACGSDSGSGGSNKSPDKLTYWASNQGTSLENDKEVLTPVLEKFTEDTGIEVDLEVIGWADLQTRIQTAITSGQGPDVVNIGNTWGVSLQATGGLLELGDEQFEALGGRDRYVPAALATGGAEGTDPTSIPLYGLAYGMYYNVQMFEDAGIEPPTTWEEMVEAAKALTDEDEGVYGMSLAAGSYTENNHFAFINATQNGAALNTEDGKPSFTEDGVVDGIMRYLDLMQEHKVVNPSNAQFDNGTKSVTAFANGEAAMIINQNNANATIEDNGMDPEQFAAIPFPAPADAVSDCASHLAGINLAIMKDTENVDGSLKFLNYMTSDETQSELGKPFASLPVLVDGKPTFTDDTEQAEMFMEVYGERAEPLPLVPWEDQFETSVGQAMNNMFATIATGGKVTRDDVMTAMQTAQDSIRA